MARIAIIDDDLDFLRYVCQALGDEGWEPLPCSDSLSAFDTVRREQPDAVLLDVRMETGQSGLDICRFLRLHPATATIPIILCSADSITVRNNAAWLSEHDVDILNKPFDLDDLYAAVAAAAARAMLANGRAASTA
ncbi:MAG TPA: response regulator [Chloroflexota bacterium]|nr:response regulator [Chloroflexota bacterium]